MRGLNKVVLIGRLGQDPELRVSKGNHPWCTFSVATERARKDGETWVTETDWHDLKVFGEDAERCHKRLVKGSMVGLDGSLVYDSWTDDAGHKHRKARVVVSRIEFLGGLKPLEPREAALAPVEEAGDESLAL